jgi:hypothetical protein
MIIRDNSGIPLPGARAELVAAVKEFVAYMDQRWPRSQPRMVIEDTLDGRLHFIILWDSLAEWEAVTADQGTDPHYQALAQKLPPLIVPGSWRQTFSRVL